MRGLVTVLASAVAAGAVVGTFMFCVWVISLALNGCPSHPLGTCGW